jgi:hypothetical protein
MALWHYCKALWKRWWALMSCAVFTGIGIYAAWYGKSNSWIVWVSCITTVIMFLVASFLAWNEEYKGRLIAETQLSDRRPKFVFTLGNVVWLYDKNVNKTVFFLIGGILNQGEPSVAISWSAKYMIGTNSEDMTSFHILGTYVVTLDNKKLSITTDDLLATKTYTKKLERGDQRTGRVLLTVDGDRTEQIKSLQYKIEVTCHDYLFTPYIAYYVPSSRPVDGLHYLATENVTPLQPVASPPQLPDGIRR